ncbi:MAG: hypothetical protein AAF581_16815 [Planctomycetota bacterium]
MNKVPTIVITAVASLAIGVFVGTQLAQQPQPSAPLDTVAVADYEVVLTERDALAEESAALRERLQTAASEKRAVEDQIAQLTTGTAPAPADDFDALAVTFGDPERLNALDGARWQELATAMATIDEEVAKLAAARAAGEEVDPEVWRRISDENTKLRAYALGLVNKLPTHASGNGEFTHPLSTANLLSAYLDATELPLTVEQREAIADLGRDYDSAFAATSASYNESTFGLQKLLDELDLKREFLDQAFDSLDAQQYDAMMRPEIRGKVRMDVLSPGVMLSRTSEAMVVGSRSELRNQLVERVAKQFKLPADTVARSAAFDHWIRELDSVLDPVQPGMASVYTVDQATVAGRAQLAAMQALSLELDLTPAQRQRLQNVTHLVVPRVTPQ